MSDGYKYGDMVILLAGPENHNSLPLNDLYPLMWTICDCSADEPIAYIPYRVYTGDLVIAKSILEGYALIPEDISNSGTMDGVGSSVTYHAEETVVGYWEEYNYSTHKWETAGVRVRGGSITSTTGGLVINPTSSYEYIDLDISGSWGHVGSGGDESMDFLIALTASPTFGTNYPYTGRVLPTDDYHTWTKNVRYWKYWNYRSGNNIRIECYPGLSNGAAGKSRIEGGSFQLKPTLEIGGGVYYVRAVRNPNYTAKERNIKFTYKGTGRYGNYQ